MDGLTEFREKTFHLSPWPAPLSASCPSSLHHRCLSLPLEVPHVLSLTPSGYFRFTPSHCLIYFHVKNMISESPASFFSPGPPVDWPECMLLENYVASTPRNELNY